MTAQFSSSLKNATWSFTFMRPAFATSSALTEASGLLKNSEILDNTALSLGAPSLRKRETHWLSTPAGSFFLGGLASPEAADAGATAPAFFCICFSAPDIDGRFSGTPSECAARCGRRRFCDNFVTMPFDAEMWGSASPARPGADVRSRPAPTETASRRRREHNAHRW